MDAVLSKHSSTDVLANNPQLEDYGELLEQVRHLREQQHQQQPQRRRPNQQEQYGLSLPFSGWQNPNLASSISETAERSSGSLDNSARIHREGQDWQAAKMEAAAMEHGFNSRAYPPGMTPDSQDGDAFFQAHSQLLPSSSAAESFYPQFYAMQHEQSPQWPGYNIFNADLEQTATFQVPHQGVLESLLSGDRQGLDAHLHHEMSSTGSSQQTDMTTLNSPITNTTYSDSLNYSQTSAADEIEAMDSLAKSAAELQKAGSGTASGQNDGRLARDAHLSLAQPTAALGSGSNPSSHVSHLNAQAERMLQASQTMQEAQDSIRRFSTTSSEGPLSALYPTSPSDSRSSSTSEPRREGALEMAFAGHDGGQERRPSMTTDISLGMNHVHLHHAASSEDMLQSMFKKPSIPQGGTLLERRKQQLPNGINVQRPKGLNLGRAFSSSALNTVHGAPRFPTSPHGSLRRHKSSNVVLNGRIQKAGPGSARNSPMYTTFHESAAEQMGQSAPQSSQATPQPPGAPVGPAQSLLQPPSPPADETADSLVPSSASTAMFTPGIYSGSLQQSYQNTPVTTPYGPGQQTQTKSAWPPASDMPQSAPAHMLSFPRDLSPTQPVPSMPSTPANMHFPHGMPQMAMFQGAMQPHVLPVVPSQPGLPEMMTFMPAHHPGYMAPAYPGSLPYGQDQFNMLDVYEQQSLWLRQNACIQQRPIEVKLDAGCDKLCQEVSEGRARLVPIERRDFTFQNLTSHDMKKQLEKD